MTESLAMALLVSSVNYARRELVLREAGDALSVVQNPQAVARLLGGEGLNALRQAIAHAGEIEARFARERIHLVSREMEAYPPLLRHIARPPHLLFVWGEARLNDICPIAVVGTRQASEYGLRHTRKIAREMAAAGVCVVSGLALGIDAAAHRGALDAGGRTVAVLGGALDRFYPADNLPLMRKILETGGSVISEYPMGVRPTRYSFVERNRIIAGMSLGVFLTEGPMRSGALHTAHSALDEGREVFALPGSVDSALSALPNRLIAEGAHVVTCAQDILEPLTLDAHGNVLTKQAAQPQRTGLPLSRAGKQAESREEERPIPPGLGEQECAVLRVLNGGETDFDALSAKTHIPADDLSAVLMLLEMDGLIEQLPGLRYVRA